MGEVVGSDVQVHADEGKGVEFVVDVEGVVLGDRVDQGRALGYLKFNYFSSFAFEFLADFVVVEDEDAHGRVDVVAACIEKYLAFLALFLTEYALSVGRWTKFLNSVTLDGFND